MKPKRSPLQQARFEFHGAIVLWLLFTAMILSTLTEGWSLFGTVAGGKVILGWPLVSGLLIYNGTRYLAARRAAATPSGESPEGAVPPGAQAIDARPASVHLSHAVLALSAAPLLYAVAHAWPHVVPMPLAHLFGLTAAMAVVHFGVRYTQCRSAGT